MSAQQTKLRRIVLTGAVASVTAMGVWYGAGLKIRNEAKQVAQKQRETPPEEKIAVLEEQRGELVAKRIALERKLNQLEMRLNGATREESMAGQERRR